MSCPFSRSLTVCQQHILSLLTPTAVQSLSQDLEAENQMLRDVLAEARTNHESASRDAAKQIRELEFQRDKLQVESDGSALQVAQLQAKLSKQEAALEEFQVRVFDPCRVLALSVLVSPMPCALPMSYHGGQWFYPGIQTSPPARRSSFPAVPHLQICIYHPSYLVGCAARF